jgi:hypothetical protein
MRGLKAHLGEKGQEQREETLSDRVGVFDRTFPQRHAGRMRRAKVVGTSCGVYARAECEKQIPHPAAIFEGARGFGMTREGNNAGIREGGAWRKDSSRKERATAHRSESRKILRADEKAAALRGWRSLRLRSGQAG